MPLIGPHIVAGSTRQQTVGRINQAADENKDEDEDEDEIPNHAVLLTTLIERVVVSRMRDFFNIVTAPALLNYYQLMRFLFEAFFLSASETCYWYWSLAPYFGQLPSLN